MSLIALLRVARPLFVLNSLFVLPALAHTAKLPSRRAVPESAVEYVMNKGQWPEAVRYRGGSGVAALFLLQDGLRWSVLGSGTLDRMHELRAEPWTSGADTLVRGHSWGISFVGADPGARIVPTEKLRHYYNYFIGPDASKWAGHVPVFGRVMYQDVWPGVDLIWHSESGHVKYDVLLDPDADLSSVALAYEGMDGLSLDARGDLLVRTSVNTVIEQHPKAWYADNGEVLVCRYVLQGDTLRFDLPEGRDPNRAVVIDPVVYAATYSGTAGNDRTYGFCAAYDHLENIYGGGEAHDQGFHNTSGAFQTNFGGLEDLAINKFTPDGTQLLWATFIGGPSDETPISMVVDGAQQVCILGATEGSGYPTTAGAYQPGFAGGDADMVITRLDASGSALIGSTYLGGSLQDGLGSYAFGMINYEWHRGDILFDTDQNLWIAGATHSDDFPVTPGAFQSTHGGSMDAVISCLSPSCDALLHSSYFGGAGLDNATSLQFAANGDVLVGGSAGSTGLATTGTYLPTYLGGGRDGYVVRFNNNMDAVVASTYFGTDGRDAIYLLDQDPDGNIFALGVTDSSLAIVPNGTYGQADGRVFIAKFDAMLSTAPLTTTIGPSTVPIWFSPTAFKVDDCGRIELAGFDAKPGFPCTNDSLHGYEYLAHQFYLAAFEPEMAGMVFGSYYGGYHTDGGMSRFNDSGVLYLAICCWQEDLDVTPGAFDGSNGADFDLGLVRMALIDDLCDITTQVVEVTGPNAIRVHPTPTSDQLTIQGTHGSGPIMVHVLDALGRETMNTVLVSGQVDVGHLSSGAYTLRLMDHQGLIGTVRFIKQ